MIFTSVGGRAFDRLESLNDAAYKRWTKTEWWSEDYTHLWRAKLDAPQTEEEASVICAKETIVYLTADSNEELMELKTDETYVIGGVVDRNRYKVPSSSLPGNTTRYLLHDRIYARTKPKRPTFGLRAYPSESTSLIFRLARSSLSIKFSKFSSSGPK